MLLLLDNREESGHNRYTRGNMCTWPEPASFRNPPPKTIKECMTCQKATPHEIRGGAGVTAAICLSCLDRALTFELNRD
jgi:hypothetical protein